MDITENLISHLGLTARELGLIDAIIMIYMLEDASFDPVHLILVGLGIPNIKQRIPAPKQAKKFVADLVAEGFEKADVLDYISAVSLFHLRWDVLSEELDQIANDQQPKNNVVQFSGATKRQ